MILDVVTDISDISVQPSTTLLSLVGFYNLQTLNG